MARVVLELPGMIATVLDGRRRLDVTGDTLADALEDAYRQDPRLKVHLVDETGAFRPHVLCFLNEENTRWGEVLDRALQDGDRILVMQAVSGG